jgi:phosphatidylserine decarboxylase
MSTRLVKWFARRFSIDIESASRPIEEYRSIGELFVRELREGLRPIDGPVVSPVDGTLRDSGAITGETLEQVKDRRYSIREFLKDETLAQKFSNGYFYNFYLSPQDYHHVHAPVSGRITSSIHIPGALWPVNDWSLRTVENLFAVNERVVTVIDSPHGEVAVVMIGATNVGKISVSYDTFITNRAFLKGGVAKRTYQSAPAIEAGEKLGTFHMGSSVVVLFPESFTLRERFCFTRNAKVTLGMSLLSPG